VSGNISKVLDVTAKKIRICAKLKRWWNGDIKTRRKTLWQENRRRGRRSEGAARAKAELQKSIRKSKSQMWSDYLQNLQGAEVWRAAKYVDPQAGATVEALTDREGKQANTAIEKEEMLRLESFPLNDDDQYYELRPPGSGYTKVTEKAVERAPISKKHFRLGGLAASESSETPGWRITPRPVSIPLVELHIALRSPFRRFFSLCRSSIVNKHSGVVANCDHTSDWVHWVHTCIGIEIDKDPRNCADSRNLARSE
jgi:hypothetical protein